MTIQLISNAEKFVLYEKYEEAIKTYEKLEFLVSGNKDSDLYYCFRYMEGHCYVELIMKG